MPSTIPIDGVTPWYTIETVLDGVSFIVELAWNTRDSRWYLTILSADGTLLVAGIPLVVDFPLLKRFADSRLPAGWLMALDTSGNGTEISEMEDLGVRVQLTYFPADEVAAL